MNVLITSGATREPIDAVRFITNFSTGQTGAALADHFLAQGHSVTFLRGEGSAGPRGACAQIPFEGFRDLNRRLEEVLAGERFDAIIHSAAVSDYSPARIVSGGRELAPGASVKLDSSGEMTIHLARNFKILSRLREYARKGAPRIVGFKLTHTPDEGERQAAIQKIARESAPDLIVHNDLTEAGKESGRVFHVYREQREIRRCESRLELARALEELLIEMRSRPS